MSLIEVSHRGKEFEACMAKARALVKELFGVPDGYDVLFLQGGASLGFHMVPMNLLRTGGKAAYLKTGEWAMRAVKDAQLVGETVVVASSEDKNFSYIPKGYAIPADADYFHFTSNNTIFGTQLHAMAKVGGAAGLRHVERHLQPAGERGRLHPDLCRRAEEHGACRHDGVHRRSATPSARRAAS